MNKLIARFRQAEDGVSAIEYALMGTLIGVAIIVGASLLGVRLDATFNFVASSVQAAV